MRAPGNCLELYIDHPLRHDAWDIDAEYRNIPPERPRTMSSRRITGRINSALVFTMQIGMSSIIQRIELQPGKKRLDFITEVDWRENRKMLRVHFPVNVDSASASFDLGAGYIERTTRPVDSRDKAKFEVAAHRYADISDSSYGVALLNDCKYGYGIRDATLDLNLLRSPKYPDSECDSGHHAFTYALLPHSGDLIHSDVIHEAARLNSFPMIFEGYSGHIELPFAFSGQGGVTLGAVKKAESGDGMIIRLYEELGVASEAELIFPEMICWMESDMTERPLNSGLHSDCRIRVPMNAFEIKTLSVTGKKGNHSSKKHENCEVSACFVPMHN